MKPQPYRPRIEPEPPAATPSPDTPSASNAPMPAREPQRHRDYDGRGLGIGPLDRVAPIADGSRFTIR